MNRRRLHLFAILAASFLGGARVAQGAASWTALGPPGGTVDVVAAAPSAPATVYAGSSVGGVFVSQDSGATWRVANAGLSDLRVSCLSVSPADSSVVYAGTPSGGFKTTDGGASWTALGNGLPAAIVNAFAIDPSHVETVYAAGAAWGLVKSADGGASWTAIGDATVRAAQPAVLALVPGQSRTLYFGSLQAGVFRSDDGGATWTARNDGLVGPGGAPALVIVALAVDPTNPARLYTAAAGAGIFRSDDGAATWNTYDEGAGISFVQEIVVAADGTAFLAEQQGVYSRQPADASWSRLPFFSNYVNSASVAGAPSQLYAGYGKLPFESGGFAHWDGAGAFTVSRPPLLVVAAIGADPATPGRAVVATTGGMFVYDPADPSGPWDPPFANGGGTNSLQLPAITLFFDPRARGVVYAGGAGEVLKSTDAGKNWAPLSTGLPQTAPPVVVRALAALPGTTQGLLAGTSQGLFQSTDGTTWSAGSADLASRQVFALAGDPGSSSLWAGTDDGLYRSGDSGVHWSRAAGGPGGVVHAVLGSRSGSVIAGADAGLFVSTDGAAWSAVPGASGAVFALAESPWTGELTAGGAGGVLSSADGGASWAADSAGLTNPKVFSLAFLTDGPLLAGTNGGSVFLRVRTADRAPVARPAVPGAPAPRALAPRP